MVGKASGATPLFSRHSNRPLAREFIFDDLPTASSNVVALCFVYRLSLPTAVAVAMGGMRRRRVCTRNDRELTSCWNDGCCGSIQPSICIPPPQIAGLC